MARIVGARRGYSLVRKIQRESEMCLRAKKYQAGLASEEEERRMKRVEKRSSACRKGDGRGRRIGRVWTMSAKDGRVFSRVHVTL